MLKEVDSNLLEFSSQPPAKHILSILTLRDPILTNLYYIMYYIILYVSILYYLHIPTFSEYVKL